MSCCWRLSRSGCTSWSGWRCDVTRAAIDRARLGRLDGRDEPAVRCTARLAAPGYWAQRGRVGDGGGAGVLGARPRSLRTRPSSYGGRADRGVRCRMGSSASSKSCSTSATVHSVRSTGEPPASASTRCTSVRPWLARSHGARGSPARGRVRSGRGSPLSESRCGSFFITMSGSRVALAAQCIFVIAAVVKHRTRRSLLLLPAVVVGAVAGYRPAALALAPRRRRQPTESGAEASDRGSTVWRYGWKAFLDRPLTGYGLGRFRPAVQRFFDADFVRVNQSDDMLEAWFESHNIIVQMTVALGHRRRGARSLRSSPAQFATRGDRCCGRPVPSLSTWLLQPARLVTFPLVALLLGASQPGVREPQSSRGDASPAVRCEPSWCWCRCCWPVGWWWPITRLVRLFQARASPHPRARSAGRHGTRWSPTRRRR